MSTERIPPELLLAPRYELLRELGRGGTAVVHLARERATGAEVAIKLIHARYAEDAEAVARFAREARFVAQLQHPNVVAVHDVLDFGDGGIALVMAHVPGRTLKQLIAQEGPLSPARTERVLRDVAAALGAAHALGIVHRDVKPENIFIDGDGRALLADFGVARSMSNETQQLTMHGVAIGTPTYMAPEQIDGAALDGRGDIYSLGLVAWEMLSGRRPWDGEALYSVLYHQKHVALPPVRSLRDDVPAHLVDAIEGATEKEPDARWQSVDELIAALDGNPPARRAPTVAAVGTETVRVTRADIPPSPVRLPERAAVPAAISHFTAAVARANPSRRVVAAGALVALIAIILLSRGVQAWSDSAARRRQALATGTDTITGTKRGAGAAARPREAVPSVTVAGEPDLVRADAPVGVAIGGAASAANGTSAAPRVGTDTPTQVAVRSNAVAPAATPAAPAALPVASPAPASAEREPIRAGTSASPVRIAAGGRHTCLVTADGRMYCWGGNDRGQLGTGATLRTMTPSVRSGEQRFVAVAPGLAHSCALDGDGAAWCWGENDRGQLGDRSTTSRLAPVRVADARRFRVIVAGASHSCALDSHGSAWCWGANGLGQLGDGEAKDRAAPVEVLAGRRLVSLEAGWNFTCGIDADARAMCWGDGSAGQLGDGGTSSRRTPVTVQSRLAFTSISAGNAHACAVTEDGLSYCWGANGSGQLGDGGTTDRPSPVHVASGDIRFSSVTAGAVHSCALATNGEAFCWGRNTYGQLGDGSTQDHPIPVRVAGGHTFSSIRAFGSHTCATTASGDAFCWGYNLDGQLGDGTRTNRSRPVYVEQPSAQ